MMNRLFTAFMLTRRAFDPGDDPLQAQPRTRYVKGRFATAEGDLFIGEKRVCQGVMNDDLLLRELSKRELKRWRACWTSRSPWPTQPR